MDRKTFQHILRTDFRAFAQKAFEILNPGTTFHDNWHIGAIAHVLDEMQAGRRRRQIINMPPRTLKSQLCSVIWPAFLLGQNPAAGIITVSYAEPLAAQLSHETRRLMQAGFYRVAKPVRLAGVSNYLEAGLVVLPEAAPWLSAFEAELLGFPSGRHDDQVDSLTQYLAWVRQRGTGTFQVDWMY